MAGTSEMDGVSPLASYVGARLRVVMPFREPGSVRPFYRRLGFEFGLHPVELTMPELGPDLGAALETAVLIASEERLSATLLRADDTELELDEGGIAAVQADLAAARVATGRCAHCARAAD